MKDCRVRNLLGQTPSPASGEGWGDGLARSKAAALPKASAFTLMEVLIAMSIFTVGAIAVAAIFPVGVVLQRETVNASMSAHVADSAMATVSARGFRFNMSNTGWDDIGTFGSTPPYIPGDGDFGMGGGMGTAAEVRTYPIPDEDAGAPVDFGLRPWSLADRGYPAIDGDAARRAFYWVPLVYDLQPSGGPVEGKDRKWMVFLFTLRREDNVNYADLGKTYPGVAADGEGAAVPLDQASSIPGIAYMGVNDPAVNPAINPYRAGTIALPSSGDDTWNLGSGGNVAPNGTLFVNVGDPILDQFGGIYKVIAADSDTVQVDREIMPMPFTNEMPDGFWFAPGQAAKRIDVLVATRANNLIYHQP